MRVVPEIVTQEANVVGVLDLPTALSLVKPFYGPVLTAIFYRAASLALFR